MHRFKTLCRQLLVEFFLMRYNHANKWSEIFQHDEEPKLVPAGMYAVVTVEYKPFESDAVVSEAQVAEYV